MARRRRGRSRARYLAEYGLLRLAAAVLALIPINFGSALAGSVMAFLGPRSERHARARRHLAAAFPERSEQEREAIAVEMWRQLGRTFAEGLMVERIIAAGRISSNAAPLLDRLKSSHTGVVFVSMHSGNFELAAVPAVLAGIDCAGVYQRMHNPYADAYSQRLRGPRYPLGIFPKGTETAQRLFRIVRGGGAVALLADLRERRGVSVPFFGRAAPTTPFPAQLARANKVPLIAARVVRLDKVRFRVEAVEIEVMRTDDREADVTAAMAAVQRQFEQWIREFPEQWMWSHRRWG